MLMDLEKLRKSETFNVYLENMSDLAAEFNLTPALADQDFFTVMGAKHPNMFRVLSCEWNYQLDEAQRNEGNGDIFVLYHSCNKTAKIYHANGGSRFPSERLVK